MEGFDDRRAAVDAFNEAWTLIDRLARTPAEDRAMLTSAFASRYHWERAGGDMERAVGDWQIAHVASLLGSADLARRFASSALEIAQADGWTDWRLASMYEGMARAHAAAGDVAERDRYAALAREVLATVEDAEDRELIESQLASIPD